MEVSMKRELKDIKIGQTAHRALKANGIVELEQLCDFSERELLLLHGVGPKAIRELKEALIKEGFSFKSN
jgi:DNA-directed RNA polymerase alpha subunit